MTHGSKQLRAFRIAIRDGLPLEIAAANAGFSLEEARLTMEADAADPPPPEAYTELRGSDGVDGPHPDNAEHGPVQMHVENNMENVDMETGEILPPAADGRALRPAASTFGQFIAFLEDGQFDADVALDLKNMAADLQDLAAQQGSAKGKLTVEVDFKVENGMFIIAAKHKVKLPDPTRPKSVAWTTEDNRFTPHKPNQGQLFGVRDVTPRSGLRDA
jgi:hypothetical protein